MKQIDRYIENSKKIEENEKFLFDGKKGVVDETLSFFKYRALKNIAQSFIVFLLYFVYLFDVPFLLVSLLISVMFLISINLLDGIYGDKKGLKSNMSERFTISAILYLLTVFFLNNTANSFFSILIMTIFWLLFSGLVSLFFYIKTRKKYFSSYQYWDKQVVPILREQEEIEKFIIKDEETILRVLEYSETISHYDHVHFYPLFEKKIAPLYKAVTEQEVVKMELNKEINKMLITTE